MRIVSVLLFVLGMMSFTCNAQQIKNRISDTIHYEYIYGKIIIPVTVNGVVVKYIVDTGGQTGTMRKKAVQMKAMSGGTSRSVSDFNGMALAYEEAVLSDVQLSENYRLSQMKSIVFPQLGFFEELGVAGILGSDAFSQAVVTFDSREQLMIIDYPYRPLGLKLSDGVEMFPGTTSHPIVEVDLGGKKKKMLFDTGAHGMLMLSVDDYEDLKHGDDIQIVDTGVGIPGVGIGGFDRDNTMEMNKIKVSSLNFVGKIFKNIETVTNQGMSLIGVDILKYGKVIVDYARNRFYFLPFENSENDLTGMFKTWNVNILPVDGHFEITAVWESMKEQVALGDRVVKIAGKELAGLEQSQTEIEQLLDSIEDDVVEIVVLKDGKERIVEIKRI